MSGHTYTHTHTYTHDNYSNPRCAHAHRGLIIIIKIASAASCIQKVYYIRRTYTRVRITRENTNNYTTKWINMWKTQECT